MLLDPATLPFWLLVTRLGEAQILLPAGFAAALWLGSRPAGRPMMVVWLAGLALATLLTTASKVAFIGWGMGLPSLNFTGVSGHAMFASAVYPLLLGVLAAPLAAPAQRWAVAGGIALALLVGISRVKVGAHSHSEVVAGWLVGGAVSAAALLVGHLPQLRMRWWIAPLVALWVGLATMEAPPSRTHDWVTGLSLALSGRHHPYTRHEMLVRAASPLRE